MADVVSIIRAHLARLLTCRICLNQIRNLDDLLLNGVLNQLRFVVNVELAHQVELVRFNGLHTQIEIAGDFFHRVAFGEHLQHFALARGERRKTRHTVGGLDAGAEIVDELRQHSRAQIAATAADVADCGDQLLRGAVLQNVAAGADFHAFDEIILVVVHGEKQNSWFRGGFS